MGGIPSCPVEFVMAPNGTSCIIKCPMQKGYMMTSAGQVLSCTHKSDPTVTVPLTSTPIYLANGQPTSNNPSIPMNVNYQALPNRELYRAEIDRFNSALAVADAKVSREVKIADAFNDLQIAENARGTPAGESAYEQARLKYYTLTRGESWAIQEKSRIANVKAQPVVDQLVSQYKGLQAKQAQQQSTIDVINGLNDKVLSVKDDLGFSVKTFHKQIDAIKNQINIDKKAHTETAKATASWFDTLLNWLIAIVTIICIVMLFRRFITRGGIEQMRRDTAFYRARTDLERARAGKPEKDIYSLFGSKTELI